MAQIIIVFSIMVLLSLVLLALLRRIGKRAETDMGELKQRAQEGTAPLAEFIKRKTPRAQIEEFGLEDADDRKMIRFAIFRERLLSPSEEGDVWVGQIIAWLTYALVILGTLALIIGVICIAAGVYEAGVASLYCAALAMIMPGILLQAKKLRVLLAEEREVLEEVYAQFGETADEREA